MSKELPLPMALPALPVAGRDAPRPVLRSTSLARMEELQQFLRQCDDKAAAHKYYKVCQLGLCGIVCSGPASKTRPEASLTSAVI